MDNLSQNKLDPSFLNKYLTEKESRNEKIASHSINLILFGSLFVLLFIFIINLLSSVLYYYSLNYPEGIVLNHAILLHKYGTYFFDIHSGYPFIHASYPPIYPFLISIFLNFFEPSLIIGRVISAIATILILYLIYKIFNNASQNRNLSIIFALFFICPIFVLKFSSICRVDMLALLFSLCGIYIFLKYYPQNSQKSYWAILFFVLSIFTKQNYIAAPVAVLIYLFFKNRKDFLKFAVLYIGSVSAIFLILNYFTKGEFYNHIIVYHFASFIKMEYAGLFGLYQGFLQDYSIFIILFIINILFIRLNPVYSIYFLINLVLLLTFLKPGSDMNYFLEPYLALLISTGLSILYILNKYRYIKLKMLLFSLLILQLFIILPYNQYYEIITRVFEPKSNIIEERINEYVRNTEGPILSHDVYYLILNKKPVNLEMYEFHMLINADFWDPQVIIDDCNNRRYKLIISYPNYIINYYPMFKCLVDNYSLIDVLNNYQVYVPKD